VHYEIGSSADIALKVEGVQEDSAGSIDTAPRNGSEIESIQWHFVPGDGDGFIFDDLAVNDADAGADGNWCGDAYIIALQPTSTASSPDWLRNDTNIADSNNHTLLDEIGPDTSDYVYSDTLDNVDFYGLSNLDVTPFSLMPADTVLKVWASATASEAVANGDEFKVGLRLSGTDTFSSEPSHVLTTFWQPFRSNLHDTKPGGGTWSQSDVNNLQVGIKVT
jgi:hypothetical protein